MDILSKMVCPNYNILWIVRIYSVVHLNVHWSPKSSYWLELKNTGDGYEIPRMKRKVNCNEEWEHIRVSPYLQISKLQMTLDKRHIGF